MRYRVIAGGSLSTVQATYVPVMFQCCFAYCALKKIKYRGKLSAERHNDEQMINR